MKNFSFQPLLCFLFLSGISNSQSTDVFRVKRDQQLVYFFQKGIQTDTVSKNRNNLFYLLVPDTLKESFSLQSENGQFVGTPNDSLVKLNFVKGIRYELVFATGEDQPTKRKLVLLTRVDGAAGNPGQNIVVRIVDKRKNTVLVEQQYFFRD